MAALKEAENESEKLKPEKRIFGFVNALKDGGNFYMGGLLL